MLVERNKVYCSKYGYTHIFETKKYDLPPWWIKVKLVQETMKTNKYKGVLWLDTDAVVHNQDKSLDSIILNDLSFYYCTDAPVWKSEFNAGVWLVLNNIHGNDIIDTWMNSYSSSDWTESDGKWKSSGEWAGSTYEQGAFIKYVIPKYNTYMYKYPWRFFQSYEPSSGTFTLHFAGEFSDTTLPVYNNSKASFLMKLINIIFVISFILASLILVLYIIYPKYVSNLIGELSSKKKVLDFFPKL
jgi:hypothetical protein